ncbi:DUF3825 domain-containing protein [Flavobacterium sp. Sd200]|uniref:DUF3825 domain-containing protein n=1 Tax=Flavobacterium sp. Sd200 TaxID=2692211 RepID=UPI0013707D24|nr:DUF3825 domain-containing protein [Flavobacterium sp. Sd200]MXN90736.1 DUF3825 domain-containing protein [Flavobacterium sp. Sd200]
MTKYNSLTKRYPDQSHKEIFAHFPYDGANGETWESPYEHLVRLTKDEDWHFNRPEFKTKYKQQFPILTNYLNYTFLRTQELNLISYSADGDKACFNTGLQTKDEKDIFALFFKNKEAAKYKVPTWTLYTFADSYSTKLNPYKPLPDLATYITNPSDLVFDTKLNIEINTEHIIDQNKDRLPAVLQANRRLAMTALNGSIESLKSKVQRNYKVAIPHWYEGKMQLLLPLNLTDDNQADVALVVDKDTERNIYRATTILTMDLAYIDARLITRPDREWLNP